MKISLEELTILIIKELLKELKKRGIEVDLSNISKTKSDTKFNETNDQQIKLDFNGFKTPLVTEERIMNLNKEIKEIIVPEKTIFTPSSLDLIKKRNIRIIKQNK